MTTATIEAIAGRLDTAWRTHTPVLPITETDGIRDVATAYAIQAQWTRMRLARGEKIVGRKIGLTSKAIQQQLGVSEPDYGTLWKSSFYPAANGRVEIPAGDFLQPRIEGEVAFLIGQPLRGPNLTAQEVLAATEACALGIEIVASRIADWRIKLADTIADNASYGGVGQGDARGGSGRTGDDDPPQRRAGGGGGGRSRARPPGGLHRLARQQAAGIRRVAGAGRHRDLRRHHEDAAGQSR
jgi:2-keto-4-pentenoate hydratase